MATTTAREGHFLIYSAGVVYTSVCTTLSDEEATTRLNCESPTGVTPWAVSKDPNFITGEPNPCPCPHIIGARHILFSC